MGTCGGFGPWVQSKKDASVESKNKVLFVGHTYIDVTFLTDRMPEGDKKYVAEDYAFSFGGNAVAAAFCCARLGLETDLLCAFANDRPGRMFQDMASDYPLQIYQRKVAKTAVSFIRPFKGKRAILRGRDAHYLRAFPVLDLSDFLALHLDGHQPDAAIYYAMECRKRGILTSLDGGRLRPNTDALLNFIDVAVVSELLCEEMGLTHRAMLGYLRNKGCKVGAVTLGGEGVLWYAGDQEGHLPAHPIPREKVIDTNGAGDVFHGSYMFSYLRDPDQSWEEHFRFASVAAALSIQHLGIEAGLPTLAHVEAAMSGCNSWNE